MPAAPAGGQHPGGEDAGEGEDRARADQHPDAGDDPDRDRQPARRRPLEEEQVEQQRRGHRERLRVEQAVVLPDQREDGDDRRGAEADRGPEQPPAEQPGEQNPERREDQRPGRSPPAPARRRAARREPDPGRVDRRLPGARVGDAERQRGPPRLALGEEDALAVVLGHVAGELDRLRSRRRRRSTTAELSSSRPPSAHSSRAGPGPANARARATAALIAPRRLFGRQGLGRVGGEQVRRAAARR